MYCTEETVESRERCTETDVRNTNEGKKHLTNSGVERGLNHHFLNCKLDISMCTISDVSLSSSSQLVL